MLDFEFSFRRTRFRISVIGFVEAKRPTEVNDAGQRPTLQDGGASLGLIGSRGACRPQQFYKQVGFQPFVGLLLGVQIAEDDIERRRWIALVRR